MVLSADAMELFCWFPAISQKSFVAMYLDLLQQPPERRDIRKLICICNVFGWYISHRYFEEKSTTPLLSELKASLERRVQDYFRVVEVGAKQLYALSSPSILSVQALLSGVCKPNFFLSLIIS